MKCPSCRKPITEPDARCPHCGLTLRKLDLRFGVAPKHFSYLTDRSLTLLPQNRAKLRTLLQLFRSKFPQSLFSVFVTELPLGTALSEYIFWLANRVQFSSVESTGENNFDLLLVIDLAAGEAGLAVGYGLENYLSEEVLRDVLEAGRSAFEAKDWSAGIERCVNRMMERMREISRAANKNDNVSF